MSSKHCPYTLLIFCKEIPPLLGSWRFPLLQWAAWLCLLLFEAASVPRILSNSMNANSVTTDAVDQHAPPSRSFTFPPPRQALPTVPPQRKAAAGVRAKSFDHIFSACMLSTPKGSAREDKAGQFWPRKAQAYSRYRRYGRLSGMNAHKYKLCHHWQLLVLISANIFNNWPLQSAVFSVLLCVCGVADHLLLRLCRAELSAQTHRHTSIAHNVILNQQLWYVY